MQHVTRRRALLLGAVAVVVSAVVVLLSIGLGRDPSAIASPLVGRSAPDFTLSQLDGKPFTLSQLRGQVVVLNFWASWCLACRDEHAGLSEVARGYVGKPVTFVGSLYQDTPGNGTQWIA